MTPYPQSSGLFALSAFLFSAIVISACRPEAPVELPLPTKICVQTRHHNKDIPNARVYLKYNASEFPGYDAPAESFDAFFDTDDNARGCIEAVPEGIHWLVAFGFDEGHVPPEVYGSMRVEINLKSRPAVDTMLYISE